MNSPISSIKADLSDDMTWDEAVTANAQINGKAAELATLLIDMRDRKGWKALGFKSWTAYLSSDLLTFSRQQLYELIRAAPVHERLQNVGITANHSVANALASFSPETQILAAKTALKRYGKLTESNARRTAEVIDQAENTGHVESNPGTTNALEAALMTADKEAAERRKVYQQGDLMFGTIYTSRAGLGVMTFNVPDTALMAAFRDVPPGTPVTVSVRYCEPSAESEIERAARTLGSGYLERRVS